MSNLNNELIYNMQADDRAYGDSVKKSGVHKDKSQKHRPQFNRMSVQELAHMEEDGDDDYEDEPN